MLLLASESYHHGATSLALSLPFMGVVALTLGTLLNRHLELRHQARNEHPLPVFHVLLIQSAGALVFLMPVGSQQGSVSMDFNTGQWILLLWLALIVSLEPMQFCNCCYDICTVLAPPVTGNDNIPATQAAGSGYRALRPLTESGVV